MPETCVDDILDRTDWKLLARQKSSLLAAMVYAEQLKRPHTLKDLEALSEWLDDLQDAAKSDGHPVRGDEMKTEFIVMTASAKMPVSCKGVYRKVAILEVAHGVTPKMISERAKGVVRMVALQDKLHAGRRGESGTAYAKALRDATRLCNALNREARMKAEAADVA